MNIKNEILKAAVEIMSLGIIIIGFVNLAGFLFNFPNLYTWRRGVPMALPTAIALVVDGVCMIILSILVNRKVDKVDKKT